MSSPISKLIPPKKPGQGKAVVPEPYVWVMFFDAGCVLCDAVAGPVCARCATALRAAPSPQTVGIDVCRAMFALDDHSIGVIAALKYRRQRRVARWLGDLGSDLVPRSADVICWVPATPARRKSRGYDHAEQLARELGRSSQVPVRQLLTRDRGDQRQTGQGRSARVRGPNLTASSRCPEFVVVVDDVITTGSSMRAAGAALRHGGAERIIAIAAAATPRRSGRRTSLRQRLGNP